MSVQQQDFHARHLGDHFVDVHLYCLEDVHDGLPQLLWMNGMYRVDVGHGNNSQVKSSDAAAGPHRSDLGHLGAAVSYLVSILTVSILTTKQAQPQHENATEHLLRHSFFAFRHSLPNSRLSKRTLRRYRKR